MYMTNTLYHNDNHYDDDDDDDTKLQPQPLSQPQAHAAQVQAKAQYTMHCVPTHVAMEYSFQLEDEAESKIPVTAMCGGLGRVITDLIHHQPAAILVAPMYADIPPSLRSNECRAPLSLVSPVTVRFADKEYTIEVYTFHAAEYTQVFLCWAPHLWSRWTSAQLYHWCKSPLEWMILATWSQCVSHVVASLAQHRMVQVVHLHDYHALLCMYYNVDFWKKQRMMITIHNGDYSGQWSVTEDLQWIWLSEMFKLPASIMQLYLGKAFYMDVLQGWHRWCSYYPTQTRTVTLCERHAQRLHRLHAYVEDEGAGALSFDIVHNGNEIIGWAATQPDLDANMLAEYKRQAWKRLEVHLHNTGNATADITITTTTTTTNTTTSPSPFIVMHMGRAAFNKGTDTLLALMEPSTANWLTRFHPDQVPMIIVLAVPFNDNWSRACVEELEQASRAFQTAYPVWKGRMFVLPQGIRGEARDSLMQAAHVGLIPSRDEPFGLVDLELSGFGALTVAADVGGLGKVDGYYFAAETETQRVYGLRACLHQAYDAYCTKTTNWYQRATATIRNRSTTYHISTMVSQYEKVYQSLCQDTFTDSHSLTNSMTSKHLLQQLPRQQYRPSIMTRSTLTLETLSTFSSSPLLAPEVASSEWYLSFIKKWWPSTTWLDLNRKELAWMEQFSDRLWKIWLCMYTLQYMLDIWTRTHLAHVRSDSFVMGAFLKEELGITIGFVLGYIVWMSAAHSMTVRALWGMMCAHQFVWLVFFAIDGGFSLWLWRMYIGFVKPLTLLTWTGMAGTWFQSVRQSSQWPLFPAWFALGNLFLECIQFVVTQLWNPQPPSVDEIFNESTQYLTPPIKTPDICMYNTPSINLWSSDNANASLAISGLLLLLAHAGFCAATLAIGFRYLWRPAYVMGHEWSHHRFLSLSKWLMMLRCKRLHVLFLVCQIVHQVTAHMLVHTPDQTLYLDEWPVETSLFEERVQWRYERFQWNMEWQRTWVLAYLTAGFLFFGILAHIQALGRRHMRWVIMCLTLPCIGLLWLCLPPLGFESETVTATAAHWTVTHIVLPLLQHLPIVFPLAIVVSIRFHVANFLFMTCFSRGEWLNSMLITQLLSLIIQQLFTSVQWTRESIVFHQLLAWINILTWPIFTWTGYQLYRRHRQDAN